MVPDDLSGEFRFVQSLVGEDANAVLLVESLASGVRQVLKLLHRSAFADDRFHQELQRRARAEGNRLNTPARAGRIRDGRYFTLTDYRANGSLHSCLSGGTPLPGGAVRPLVRDTARALEQLHEERHGVRIVHGDVKPSNLLVLRRGRREADWEFRLSDFDSSILLESGCPGAPAAHTAAYAAPEVLRTDTAPDVAMDYWSMGMLLLASLLGRHPFGDLPDDQVTDLLVNQEWTIDPGYISQVQDESCRALLGGLLRRVPEQRWGADEVRQWIEGEPKIVARGLRLLGENAADEPFAVNGEHAYTVSNLAIALLRSWNTDLLLGSGGLSGWLRRLNPGAADHLEGIRHREADADAALLDFCGTYHPGERMPPVWRGEEVSARNFARLAARANDGDRSARARLLAFLQPDGHRYFTSGATYPDVAALVESIGRARGEYLEAWQTIAGANGPRSMSSDEESWIHAALIACSPVDEEDHRARIQEIFDPLLVMRRADWFLAFGTDPDRINPSQLFVLMSLQQASLLEDVDIAHLDGLGNFDARRLREGIVLPESQRRLLEELTVRPGARIDRVEAGETYAPERSPSLKDVVADGMGRGFRWCHARLRRRGEEPRRPREDSRIEMRMRIVRLTIKATRLPVGEEDELYLALISWTGAGPGARLFVANPSTVFPVPPIPDTGDR